MKQKIIEMVKNLVGNEYLYFDSSLLIKTSPHTWPIHIWGVAISQHNEIYLMDGLEYWHKLDETDLNYSIVLGTLLGTLYQRVASIHK